MVKNWLFNFVLVTVLILSVCIIGLSSAQDRIYSFNFQYAKIWINQDGTIDLFYNVSLTLDSGPNINFVRLGQPNGDFTVGDSFDQFGRQLEAFDDSSGSNFRVRINLFTPLTQGNTIWFTVTTNVGNMIYDDDTNPGNLGMQFIPEWQEVPINDVRVEIVVPPNVSLNEIKTLPDAFWNSTSVEPDGRIAVYWEKPVLQAGEQFPIGVSFPAQYLPDYQPPPPIGITITDIGILAGIVGFSVVIIVVVVLSVRKKPYTSPKVSMETLGSRRGLTAVESSYLLDLKPNQIITEILYSLLQKRAIWVESANPTLKLRIMPEFQNKKGDQNNPLRYYEIDFLEAIKSDGTLDEEKLARAFMYLRDTVEQKMRGYSRKDTVDYYRKVVDKAWMQVTQAGTPDIASKVYDEELLWLLLDPNFRQRTQTTFQNKSFEPSPLWFWYWYGYTMYRPNPAYTPNVNIPTQSSKPPTIPGADFANNIATSIEKTSGNIVASMEKFASAIIPPPPSAKASHEPAKHKADCVCACASCACACACVSCACACAGGGVG